MSLERRFLPFAAFSTDAVNGATLSKMLSNILDVRNVLKNHGPLDIGYIEDIVDIRDAVRAE